MLALETSEEASMPMAAASKSSWAWRVGAAGLVIAAALAVLLLTRGSTGESPRQSAQLPTHSDIKTQNAGAKLTLLGAELEVHPNSHLSVEQAQSELALRLHEGGLHLRVAPRDHTMPVSIQSGDVKIEVVGTVFSVFRAQGQTQVVVDEGIVAVQYKGRRDLVSAGESWPSSVTRPSTPPVTAQAVLPAPDAGTNARAHPGKIVKNTSARDLFEEAARVEHAAPAKARKLYGRAARASGPWAANALFAQARLALAQGDKPKGKAGLLRYLKRYPSGPNAADARALLKGRQ